MPLIVCTIVLIILFSLEGFWRLSDESLMKEELDRYEGVEHPRHRTSDAYLDLL